MNLTITINIPVTPMVIMGSTSWASGLAVYEKTQDEGLAFVFAVLMVVGQAAIASYYRSRGWRS